MSPLATTKKQQRQKIKKQFERTKINRQHEDNN
jgi:hypothetical protein